MASTSGTPAVQAVQAPLPVTLPSDWQEDRPAIWGTQPRDQFCRLVYIHRDFFRKLSPPPAKLPFYDCFLKAWILGTSTMEVMNYSSEQRIQFYNQYSNDTTTQFQPFQVIIPRITVHNHETNDGKIKYSEDIVTYFNQTVPRQLGNHIFISYYGELQLIKAQIDLKGNYNCTLGKTPPITAIYPVISYRYEDTPKSSAFVFGLEYKSGDPPDRGNRYYHRNNDRVLRHGNVSEITFDLTNDLTKTMKSIKEKQFFGLYLCAGARLVVSDGLNQEITKKGNPHHIPHNRDLYQQGGVLFFNGELRLSFYQSKILDSKKKEFRADDMEKYMGKKIYPYHPFGYPHFSCKQFSQCFTGKKVSLRTAQNPILFLGPIDSNFQTISWSLSVMAPGIAPTQRIGFLEVPEGARIMAIANGEEAIDELRARLQYEKLQDSVVIAGAGISASESQFLIEASRVAYMKPENDILKNILDPDEARVLEVDPQYIGRDTTPAPNHPKPLYQEYNTRKFTNILKSFDYFVPPMYPPFYYPPEEVGMKAKFLYYGKKIGRYYPERLPLFSGVPNTDPTRYVYRSREDPSQQVTLQYKRLDEYQWQRIDKKDVLDAECHEYRTGVDGWRWQKNSEEPVATMKTLCYVKK